MAITRSMSGATKKIHKVPDKGGKWVPRTTAHDAYSVFIGIERRRGRKRQQLTIIYAINPDYAYQFVKCNEQSVNYFLISRIKAFILVIANSH